MLRLALAGARRIGESGRRAIAARLAARRSASASAPAAATHSTAAPAAVGSADSCSSCGAPASATLPERQLRCLLHLAEHHTARRVEQRLGASYAKPLAVRRLHDLLQLAPVGQEFHRHCAAGRGHGSCARLHHALEAEAESAARALVEQEVPRSLVQVSDRPRRPGGR